MFTITSVGLLAALPLISASVLELPVHVQNSYSSVEFQIGTPPKPYRLRFDTGSATTWLTSASCTTTSCPNLSGYSRTSYDPLSSSSSVGLNSSSRIPYIDGDGVSGFATRDIFNKPCSNLAWNQTFLSVNESSWRFVTADGFLGLGFSSISEPATSSLVETLLWDNQLDAPRFGLFYGTNLADNGTQNGVLTIGGSHEETYVEGDVVYTPLRREDPYQLWRTPLRSVNVLVPRQRNASIVLRHGELPGTTDTQNEWPHANVTWNMFRGTAVFDTGAGRIALPNEVVSAVYYNLGWNLTKLMNGQERMECRHLNSSWAISLTLGEADPEDDVTFTIRGDEFTEPGAECMPPVDTTGQNSFALIGRPFLQRFYTVFDFGANTVQEYVPRIGFGRLKREWDYMYQ